VLIFSGTGLLACPEVSQKIDRNGKVTLNLSRPPTADEMIAARLTVGVLARDTRIVVRTGEGEIAGTIAPFGVRPGHKAGVFTVPIPAKAVSGNKVSLRLEVLEKDAKAARAPARTEIEDAKLVFIPVAPRVERKKRK
jgi:hypothetical protein